MKNETIKFSKEEVIFRKNENSKNAYIIQSGKVGIYKETDYGKRTLVRVLDKSDLFGEMGLIDKYPRSATAIALEDCSCVILERSQFTYLSKHSPAFLVTLIKTLTSRLRNTLGQLKDEGKLIEEFETSKPEMRRKKGALK